MAARGAGGSLERRYEGLSGGRDRRFVYYIFRRYLGLSVEEVDALPWWQKQMYLEEWTYEREQEARAYEEAGGGHSGTGAEDFWGDTVQPALPGRTGRSNTAGRSDYPELPADFFEGFEETHSSSVPGMEKHHDPDTLEGIGESFGVSVRRI